MVDAIGQCVVSGSIICWFRFPNDAGRRVDWVSSYLNVLCGSAGSEATTPCKETHFDLSFGLIRKRCSDPTQSLGRSQCGCDSAVPMHRQAKSDEAS